MKLFYNQILIPFTPCRLKGSDASWEHDEEPPQEVIFCCGIFMRELLNIDVSWNVI